MDVKTFREHYRNLRSEKEQLNEATSSWFMRELVRPALRSAKRRAKQEFKKGAKTIFRVGKKGVKALYNRMIREEVLNYLIAEGYALDVMDAEDLIQELDEGTIEDILDEVTGSGRVDPDNGTLAIGISPRKKAQAKARRIRKEAPPDNKDPEGRYKAFKRADTISKIAAKMEESSEMILNYLISEGYADNIDSAVSILESMSDEWFDEIIEAFKPSDYEEYHRNNHIDPNDRSQEREDDYLEYLRSKEDIRDNHNRSRGVKKKKGSK